jgi:hypothetical protein
MLLDQALNLLFAKFQGGRVMSAAGSGGHGDYLRQNGKMGTGRRVRLDESPANPLW